jgi:hypothetical protein
MIKAGLRASFSSTLVVLVACFGCLAQQDLSSYSEGASSPTVEPPGSSVSSSADDNDDNTADASELASDVDDPEMSPAEGQDPADVSLDSAGDAADPADDPSGSSDGSPDPGAAVPEATIAGVTCTADGEFTSPRSNSCYLLSDTTSSFLAARELCQAWGGDLVEIGSAEEDALLTGRSDEDAWIGASDELTEGTFLWPGGGALVYTRWAPGQPDNYRNEDCAELRAMDDIWNDVPCDSDKRPLCEKPLPELGSGG